MMKKIIAFILVGIFANISLIDAQIGQITRRLIGQQDISFWDGVTSTYNYVDLNGNLLTLNKLGNEVDVCSVYGANSNTTQAALQAAITAVGTVNKMTFVLRPGTWPITSSLSIPTNITLKVVPGALLTIATTKTLTINGTLEAGSYQIFSCAGTGKVVFGAGSIEGAHPEWWATNTTPGTTDMTAAIQAAITAYPTLLITQVYASGTIDVANIDNIYLKGYGWNTGFKLKDAGTGALFKTDAAGSTNQFKAENFFINGNKASHTGGYGFLLVGQDIEVTGIYAYDCDRPFFQISPRAGITVQGINVHHNIVYTCGDTVSGYGAIASAGGSHQSYTDNIIVGDGNQYYGIDIEPSTDEVCEDFIIARNQIYGGNIQADFDSCTLTGKRIKILDNYIDSRGYTGATKPVPIFLRAVDGVDVRNNTGIGHILRDIYGISATEVANFQFVGNRFYGTDVVGSEYGIYFVTVASSKGLVADNEFISISGTLVNGVYSYNKLTDTEVRGNKGTSVTNVVAITYTLNANCIIDAHLTPCNVGVATVTTGEDNLYEYVFPQNFHLKYNVIDYFAAGTKSGAGGNKTIKLYLGTASYTVCAAANDTNDWIVRAKIYLTGAATQKIVWEASNGITLLKGYETATQDFSAGAITLKLTGECADAGDVITQSIVDVVPSYNGWQ